jgi:hypothetical protein
MSIITYYPGGHTPTAPALNIQTMWNDTNSTVTQWDTNGNVINTRAYTNAEQTIATAQATSNAIVNNLAQLTAASSQAITNNVTYINNASQVAFPLSIAAQTLLLNQVVALTKQVDALIRITINQLNSTTGT